jgi:hypothetical protein
LFSGFVTLLSVSCVSSPQERSDVIERSAETRPAWAEGDTSSEGTGEIFLLHKKGEITRLELGIKQTQAAAMDVSCRLVQERIKKDFVSRAPEKTFPNPALANALDAALPKVESTEKCPEVAPKFVYWELLRKDTAEGSRQAYDVYVLLSLKKSQFLDALGVVLESVKGSGVEGAGALAESIAESYNDAESE